MDKLERLKELISENLDVNKDDITEETDLINDLDADSLDIVELAMAIEDEFDLAIEDDQLEEIKTVADILKRLG